MNKITVLFIASLFVIPGFLAVHGQQNTVQDSTNTNNTTSQNIFDQFTADYQHGVKLRNVLPVAIGILAFSFFIVKTSTLLSKREIFTSKRRYTAEGVEISARRKKIIHSVEILIIFPIIVYGWIVVCFFFMYALNTSLSFGALMIITVGIIFAARIASYWNEKLAEEIMKFLPFSLLFTLLINPVLDTNKILSSIEHFPIILFELTIFIIFTGILEGVLKLIHFQASKGRHPSTDRSSPIKET
ncbi:hypothetical protein [Candidatus Nitrosotalea bavarica]|uniref:hypothetical protein n=1 Tax=Candidatus Nitrosotalea bavarica TaxID=1903277 RepID=UPI000C700A68|nr:hypothetical protein [Candidatus Nitrosotalea bavarica]